MSFFRTEMAARKPVHLFRVHKNSKAVVLFTKAKRALESEDFHRTLLQNLVIRCKTRPTEGEKRANRR